MSAFAHDQRPPICAVCHHEVERFTSIHDPKADRFVMVAECHGAREEVAIRAIDLVAADGVAIVRAFASQTPVLPVSR